MQKRHSTVLIVAGLGGSITERVRLQASSSRLLAVQRVRWRHAGIRIANRRARRMLVRRM